MNGLSSTSRVTKLEIPRMSPTQTERRRVAIIVITSLIVTILGAMALLGAFYPHSAIGVLGVMGKEGAIGVLTVGTIAVFVSGYYLKKRLVQPSSNQYVINTRNLSKKPMPITIPEINVLDEAEIRKKIDVLRNDQSSLNGIQKEKYEQMLDDCLSIDNFLSSKELTHSGLEYARSAFLIRRDKNKEKEMRRIDNVRINTLNVLLAISGQFSRLSKDQRRKIVLELACAATNCHPTWYEVAWKQYEDIMLKQGEVENRLLTYVQEYKEIIILERHALAHSEDNDWHFINHVRGLGFGKSHGLSNCGLDSYALPGRYSYCNKQYLHFCFEPYMSNPDSLVDYVKTRIDVKCNDEQNSYGNGYDMEMYDFILKSNGGRSADENFYENDECTRVKKEYVAKMLVEIGILSS